MLLNSVQSLPSPHWASILVLLLIVSSSRATLALLGVLALHAAGAATAVWRAQGEVDVLLAVQPHHEGWDVHNLLAHTRGRDRRRENRRASDIINQILALPSKLTFTGAGFTPRP